MLVLVHIFCPHIYPKMKLLACLIAASLCVHVALSQQISKEELIFLTPEWEGPRFDDGRPKVSDDLLKRMRLVTLEEAWAVLKGANFKHQYAGIPKVVRSNRTSVAVIHEGISEESIVSLGKDVFLYNGLGCRNVSHLCIVGDFDLERFKVWENYPSEHIGSQYLKVFEREKAKMKWLGKDFFQAGKVLLSPATSFNPPPISL